MKVCNIDCYKYGLSDYLRAKRKFIIWFSIIFVIGLVAGILTVGELKNTFSTSDVSDILLVDCLSGDVTIFGYYFKRLFSYVLTMIVIFLLCLNFYSGFFTIFFIFYMAYKIGINISIYVMLYGIGGVLNVVLIYLPIQLILNFILIVFACHTFGNACEMHRTKCRLSEFNYKFCLVFACLFLFLCLVESLLIPSVLRNISISA